MSFTNPSAILCNYQNTLMHISEFKVDPTLIKHVNNVNELE